MKRYIIGAGAVLLVAACVSHSNDEPRCSAWHNMKITTNEDAVKRLRIQQENGWQVDIVPHFAAPCPSITKMTVEVCKICGKPTALTTESKRE